MPRRIRAENSIKMGDSAMATARMMMNVQFRVGQTGRKVDVSGRKRIDTRSCEA
jgi:hypothetical protein